MHLTELRSVISFPDRLRYEPNVELQCLIGPVERVAPCQLRLMSSYGCILKNGTCTIDDEETGDQTRGD